MKTGGTRVIYTTREFLKEIYEPANKGFVDDIFEKYWRKENDGSDARY